MGRDTNTTPRPSVMGGGTAATSHPPRPRRLAGPRVRRQAVAWAFAAPVVAYLVAFYGYPLYRNVDLSVRNYTVMSFVHGHAPFVGLQNYRADIRDATFSPALFHTLVFTFISIAFQFAIGLGLAVFFNKRFRLSAT